MSVALWLAEMADIFFRLKARGSVFLHYDVVMGVNLQGQWWEMYYLPLGGAVILAVNTGLAFVFYPKNKLLGTVIVAITAVLELILLVSIRLIVNINL